MNFVVSSPLPILDNAFPPAGRRRSTRRPFQTRWRSGPEDQGGTPGNARQRVTLNGEPVPMAFAADVMEGTVTVYVDAPGKKVLAAATQLDVKILRGEVRIIDDAE